MLSTDPTDPTREPPLPPPPPREPDVVGHWNWAAFALTPIWAAFHRIWWLAVLSIFFGLPLGILAGVKGNGWAWENDRRGDAIAFDHRQRRWSRAGWITLIVGIVIGVIAAAYQDRAAAPAQPTPAAAAAPVPAPAGWRVEWDTASGFALAIPDTWTRVELAKDRFPASFDSFRTIHPASAKANRSILRSYVGYGSFALVEPGADRSAVAVVYGYPDPITAGASKRAATEARSESRQNSAVVSVGDLLPIDTPAGQGWGVRAETASTLVCTTSFLGIGDRVVEVDFYVLRSYEDEHRTVQKTVIASIRRPAAI